MGRKKANVFTERKEDPELDFSEVDKKADTFFKEYLKWHRYNHFCQEICFRHSFEDLTRAIVKLARGK